MVHKVVRVIGVLYLAYLAIAVLLVLPVLNTLPHWYVKDTFGRRLNTELVLFNPFTFSLMARGASLPETDGAPFAALEKAEVDLSLSSLWRTGWVFDAISVEELYLHIRQVEPGRFNFTDMLEAMPATPPSPQREEEEGLPGITIIHLDLGARRITLSDEAREIPFSTHYDGLAIAVKDLSTIVEEGKPYQISAVAESGGTLHWAGTVSVPGSRSEGRLTLENLSLAPFWRFAEPWLNLELRQGYVNISGDYRLNWDDGFHYAVDGGALAVRDIDVLPKKRAELQDTQLALEALTVDGIAVDSRTQHADIAALHIRAPAISGWMEGETISLQELFAVSLPDTAAASAPEPESGEPASPWTASLGEIRVSEGGVRWRSPYTDPPLLQVSPLEAQLGNLSWPLQGTSPLALRLTVNGKASLEIDGSLALGSGAGTLQYEMAGLPLAWFNPNLPTALNGKFTGGHAAINGDVALAAFAPSTIKLSGAVRDFAGVIAGEEDSVTSWKAVRLKDLQVDMEQREITLAQVIIDNYEGRLHIAEDGSVNAFKVWQEEVGEEAEELVEELELDVPWKFRLPEIYVSDSAIDFKDESLPIQFRTVIGNLNGEVLGISNEPGAEAEVDMKGSVDGYAPVALSGTAAPFDTPPALDLALSFNGVDLSLLTPYSGTYAGYAIERGLLNLDLAYSLGEGHLEGNNEVVISQLKLGEKIDSDRAVDLPLELALALLTDANGVIDLAVPVSGDVDDPEFSLGSVIGGAFVNLITKAATAPFALLANLVGAEEDLQRLNFASGSAELSDSTTLKLDQLSEALDQRPGLALVVMGRLNLEADTEKLKGARLKQAILASGLTLEQVENKDDAFVEEIERRYRALGLPGELPSPPKQYDAVRQSMPLGENELRALAEARSVAIKTYLVNDRGIAADRVAIEQTPLDDEAHKFSGVELAVET